MNRIRKQISFILTLILCFSLINASVSAEETAAVESGQNEAAETTASDDSSEEDTSVTETGVFDAEESSGEETPADEILREEEDGPAQYLPDDGEPGPEEDSYQSMEMNAGAETVPEQEPADLPGTDLPGEENSAKDEEEAGEVLSGEETVNTGETSAARKSDPKEDAVPETENNIEKEAALKTDAESAKGLSAANEAAAAAVNVVRVSSFYFPDSEFRSEITWQVDADRNGYLTDVEIAACTKMNLHGLNISNLKGLEYLTGLKQLYCGSLQITSLDVSALKSLELLSCRYDEKLTSLSVSDLSLLKEIDCSNSAITGMNLSGLTALQTLDCNNNQLTGLNLTGLTSLQSLNCDNNRLTSLNVSGLSSLKVISCCGNQLTGLNLTGLSSLQTLSCYDNQLTSLTLSYLPALEYLYCYNNQMTSLTLGSLPLLRSISCHDNQLTALRVSGLASLQNLNCSSNKLTSLSLSDCPNLDQVYAQENRLSVLNINECAYLSVLNLSDNYFNTLNLEDCPALWELNVSYNNLTSLDLSDLMRMYRLNTIGNNSLESIDITGTPLGIYDPALSSGNLKLNTNFQIGMNTSVIKDSIVIFRGRPGQTIQLVGSCGQKAFYAKWNDGQLAIFGTGPMKDYSAYDYYGSNTNASPWQNDSSIQSIDIGEGITGVGSYAFQSCKATTLDLHGDLTIGAAAFNLAAVSAVDFGGYNVELERDAFLYSQIRELIFGTGTVVMKGSRVFGSCKNLTEVLVPATVTMSTETFQFCTELVSAEVNTEGPLPSYTFEGCTSLESVKLGENITSIGSYCFRGAPLKSLTLPASVTEINPNALNRTANGVTYPNVPRVRVENPQLDLSVLNYGISPSTTVLEGPACSKTAAFAQRVGYTFTAIDDSKHTEEITQGTAPTCTETGLTEGSQCSVCGAILREQEIVPALGHDWGEPAWSWKTTADDVYISAAAAFTCGHDGTHKEELEDTELDVVTVDPTPTEAGSVTYTASVTGPDGKTYTDSKEVPIPAAGYTYKDPVYTWVKTEEGYLVKALKECCEDAGQNITEEAEAAYTEKTAAACTSEGMGLYTAVFTNSAFETQTKEVVIPATGHSWDEGKVTRPPTYTETGIMTYTCTVCGETKTEEIDKLEPEEPEIEVKHSLNLQDEILVNFYYIGVDADQAADSSVRFTFEGKETVVTGGKATKVSGQPTVVYTFATAAKKMTEPIKAEFTIAGEVVDTHEYTVKQYCDDQLAKADIDAGLKKLLEATLNYGGYSQVNFSYNTDKMANAGIDSTLVPLSPSAIEAPAFDKAAVNTGVKASGLTYEGATLTLEASTNLKFYFKPNGITQDAALKVPVKVDGKAATLVKNGQYVCLTVTGIKAKYLGQAYDITVGSYTFRYSPLNYIKTQLDGTNTNLKNVLTAMYYYYQAAKEYF